jgi:hypothetical protein
MAKKQRLYLLRVDEKCLPPQVKDYALRPCRRATNIAIRQDGFQPCIALGELPAREPSLVIWAASTNYLPIYLLREHLSVKFTESAPALFVHALDTAIVRRARDGLLHARPEGGQYLVTDLRIKDVDEYIDQQYREFQERREEEEELEELEAMREAEEECDAYLDAWELYQAEDDLDEEPDEEWAGEWDQAFGFEEEDGAEGENEPAVDEGAGVAQAGGDLAAVRVELAHLRRFACSPGVHGEPGELAGARCRLDGLLEQWQFSPSDFSPQDIALLKQLMQHVVFHPRKAHCFKCKRHLYDHLDRTCLNCLKFQIVCSDPSCGACGCKHDPSFARK